MITDISNPECDIKECLYVFYNWARNTYDNNLRVNVYNFRFTLGMVDLWLMNMGNINLNESRTLIKTWFLAGFIRCSAYSKEETWWSIKNES